MQKIKIHKLGPISDCEVSIKGFMVLTGPQASGKSTLAKSIFFFKNMKNVLLELLRKNILLSGFDLIEMSCKNRFIREIRLNFLQTFGSTWCMSKEMYLEYQFTPTRWIRISLTDDAMRPNYIWIDMSEELQSFLYKLDKMDFFDLWHDQSSEVKKEIETFFEDTREILYIPAGRSLITLLYTKLPREDFAVKDIFFNRL